MIEARETLKLLLQNQRFSCVCCRKKKKNPHGDNFTCSRHPVAEGLRIFTLAPSVSNPEGNLCCMKGDALKLFTKSFTFCKGKTRCSPFPSYLPGFLPIFPPRYDFAGGQVSNSTAVPSSWHIFFITCAHLGREMRFLFPWESFFHLLQV